jgi:hypothetical protein
MRAKKESKRARTRFGDYKKRVARLRHQIRERNSCARENLFCAIEDATEKEIESLPI